MKGNSSNTHQRDYSPTATVRRRMTVIVVRVAIFVSAAAAVGGGLVRDVNAHHEADSDMREVRDSNNHLASPPFDWSDRFENGGTIVTSALECLDLGLHHDNVEYNGHGEEIVSQSCQERIQRDPSVCSFPSYSSVLSSWDDDQDYDQLFLSTPYVRCRASCNFCILPNTTTATTAAVNTTIKWSYLGVKQSNDDISIYQRSLVSQVIQESIRYLRYEVLIESPYNTMYYTCQNYHELCSYWAAPAIATTIFDTSVINNGTAAAAAAAAAAAVINKRLISWECINNSAYMSQYCPLACKQCNHVKYDNPYSFKSTSSSSYRQ